MSFETIVSSMKPYGLRGDIFNNFEKYNLPKMSNKETDNCYKVVGLENLKRTIKYAKENYPFPVKSEMINKYKIFITRNWGIGSYDDVPSTIVIASPKTVCTETFLEIGAFKNKKEAYNAYKYISTKFFRALVSIRKQDQGSSKSVYHFVPLQDFSTEPTDKDLYKKYDLTDTEINFIETEIKEVREEDLEYV